MDIDAKSRKLMPKDGPKIMQKLPRMFPSRAGGKERLTINQIRGKIIYEKLLIRLQNLRTDRKKTKVEEMPETFLKKLST